MSASSLCHDPFHDNSRAIEYTPAPRIDEDNEMSTPTNSVPPGTVVGHSVEAGNGQAGRKQARRPSVELDFDSLYAAPAENMHSDLPLVEAMPTTDSAVELTPTTFSYENPRRLSAAVPLDPQAEDKHTDATHAAEPNKKESKPSHKPFSFSVLLNWAGKSKKKGEKAPPDTPVKATTRKPLLALTPPSFSRSTSRGVSEESKSQLISPRPTYNPHAPLLRFIKDKITVPSEPKPVVVSSKSDVFAKAVILGLEAVSAARDMLSEDQSNEGLGLKLIAELEAMADIYKSFGDFHYALALIQEAIALRRERDLGSKFDLAISLNDLGLINCEIERFAVAYDLFEEAFYIIEEHNGGPCADSAACLGNAGVALRGSKSFSSAITAHDKAVTLMKDAAGENHFYSLQQKAMLALSLFPAGDVLLSTRMLREVISTLEGPQYENHPYLKYLKFEYDRIVQSGDE